MRLILLLIFFPALVKAQGTDTVRLLVPEFFHYSVIHHGDTTFSYQCYDVRDSIINELTDFSEVRYISVIKRYIDHTQTYRDNDRTEKPLPIQKIVYRYDKLGNDKWLSVDYADNKYRQLKEEPKEIVRTEIVTDERTKKPVVCTFFKITEQKY
jgi:hypothetical protein